MAPTPYTIQSYAAAKKIDMRISGSFTPEDYQNFIRDYNKITSAIDASAYTLEVDCREMNLLRLHEIQKLKSAFVGYKETGFSKVIFIISASQTIMKMQLASAAREAGLMDTEIITQ
ncbi:hypothetical protein B9G55_03795 [Saccharibacillus sp. O16]|nr:hypothetical protein B9G55_03795 [Saccharibacillus sp. O16]